MSPACLRHGLLRSLRSVACLIALNLLSVLSFSSGAEPDGRRLYVACPGVRNYLEYGGHGLLVFDIDHEHKFIKRIPLGGLDEAGKPSNVKGICACAATARIYVSTIRTLQCVDLRTEQRLWERTYPGGCDRMSIAPDGSHIYLPSFEQDHWLVVDGATGDVIARITPNSKAHNTVYGLSGKTAYLAGLGSPLLTVADTSTHTAVRTVGPFTHNVRPFTVNRAETVCYVNINELLGFEMGDLLTGKTLARVEVDGFEKGPVKRHGCPSHGVGLTPDEREVWVTDAHNRRLHIFDNTVMPPKQVASIRLKDEPGWVTFSLDGRYAYPSTGDIVDTASREVVTELRDETDTLVQSEKMIEIHWQGGQPVRNGDQFGLGRKPAIPVAGKLLNTRVDGNFKRVPLQEALARVAKSLEMELFLDGDALKQAGWTRNMPVMLSLGDVSAEQALAAILGQHQDPLHQMVLCIDEKESAHVLRVTTRAAAVAEQRDIYKFAAPPQ